MRTRTLLLLSLACGAAIMVAGAVFLFQLTTQDELVEPVPLGTSTQVGDMDVTVTGTSENDGVLRVDVTIGGTDDPDPADEFRLIASGRPVPISTSDCPPVDGDPASCTVEFELGIVDGVSRVLFYERGDDRARWVLAS